MLMPRTSLDSNRYPSPLIQHRGITDLARSALGLTPTPDWAETKAPDRVSAYPSPPMSGSPPTSQKAASDASDLVQASGSYPPRPPQDGYRGQPSPTESRSSQGQPPPQDPYARSYPHEPAERMAYRYQQPREFTSRPISFPSQGLPSISQQQPYLPAGPNPPPGYPMTCRPPPIESQPFITSPKSQRKVKGHVASACVPCKRAHLRCDSQRPCSRCLSNGKEDSCHDVVHKKRGRPRLRDDREARYDLSRPPPPHDAALRRPLNIYPSSSSAGSGYVPLGHVQTEEILKSYSSEPLAPRYMNRGSVSDGSVYGQPLAPNYQIQEPVAYLTMDLEFTKASETFLDALGGLQNRRALIELVVPGEREKVISLQNHLFAEQKQREPNYLPPILGRGEQIVQALGFGAAEIGRFQLNHLDYLTLTAADGQPRVFPIRMGLGKEGSFYFVLLVLGISPRFPYPSNMPQDRTAPPQGYPPPMPHTFYGQPQHAHRRMSEGPLPVRQPSGIPSQILPTQSPGINQIGLPSYSASSNRPAYPGPSSYHTPRSEIPGSQPPFRQSFQLPPIRAPLERDGSVREHGWQRRDERSSRVDIGGLIEKPEAPGRPH